ncbi:two pore domain potassium channel family protein [Pseudomonas fulva]|uniref:potassium channel family protein n=1 Tax=Pseudomonas fulva TaxID=47880 RepID=UPI0018AB5B97|nr:potassium channel family protein [Pseudomonas fulva]MBF8673662.1 two pore domain potassium channel family protein [Pseudomonas fulva]MBF8696164.1 two pore domain potassium channel family protein [Pseudomonas fulva]
MNITKKPSFYGALYLIMILVFTLVYYFFFGLSFKDLPKLQLIQSLYFSIVTISTLGFGDIIPKQENHTLLLTICSQVIIGVVLIGLFLNSLSHKMSDLKEAELSAKQESIKRDMLSKQLSILKPIILSHLEVIAETVKITSTEPSGTLETRPRDLFDQLFFDKVSMQDFYSSETRYGEGTMLWANFVDTENKAFIEKLESYLIKFSAHLPIEIIENINHIQNHSYLQAAKSALNILSIQQANKIPQFPKLLMLSIEHSSHSFPDKPNTISNYHESLLKLISSIDFHFPETPIMMTLHLTSGTYPRVGSGIGEIVRFGPFDQTH